ncbi:MAG: hypothetical protein LBI54_09500 [Lachnospiraceae bacterium]|jgi:hypothetical protein|nr:hypothetical protein [Lachnospiraceae bacterium]
MPKKHPDPTDDGRVIAPMNVDGMPWYTEGGPKGDDTADPPAPFTFRENLAFLSGVLKASLLVTFVFLGALFVFILFCVNVWFK